MSAIKSEYVPRVNQLDALYLNRDVVRLTRDSLLEHLQSLYPQLFAKIQPELDFALHSAIWLFSVGKRSSTFGQQLLVLSYDKELLTFSRLCLHFTLTVMLSYIKSLEERRLNIGWLHQIVKWGESTTVLLSIFNFFRFLNTGSKPCVVDFLLGLKNISLQQEQRRDIGYKYLNRELLWGGFMEMLGLILPIINFRKIKGIFKKILIGENKRKESITGMSEKELFVKMSNCSYCGKNPIVPHRMRCGHLYCYYCLAANITCDSNFSCSLCGAKSENGKICAL